MTFSDDLIVYQSNVWPAMAADLGSDLGVSARSLVAIGVGWIPDQGCWVFPERDAEGQITGLGLRYKDGKKGYIKGGHRGLTYTVSPSYSTARSPQYIPGSHNWTRCSEAFPCPICLKPDYCLLSSENPSDPQAVICGRIAEGSTQPLGEAGHLHIRKESGKVSAYSTSPLSLSSLPVLIVEGQSDVAAAYDLGFVAIGKPSASSGLNLLCKLIVGRACIILGENDAGAGRTGMEKTFEAIKSKAKSCVKVMPPEGIKDLRAWLRAGLTKDVLLEAITGGTTTSSPTLLDSVAPLAIADRWLHERHWLHGNPILRLYQGTWYRFDGTKYAKVDKDTFLRGDLYMFLKDKTYAKPGKDGPTIVPYEADMHCVSEVIDALTMTCPVYVEAPCWLDDEEHPCIQNIVNFSNGMLLLPECVVERPTARFFSLTSLPYPWSNFASCETWVQFLSEIFPNDPEKILLLQEWFGYNMVADTSYEKLMFLVGRPGAGKGTVLEALRAVLGSNQVASTSFDSLVGDFGLQPLLGKLAAILPDAHITRRGDPAKALQVLKEISGRDGVGINRKNREFLSDHKLSCRFTISVNAMPDLPDHERSLDRRLLLLHFGESFAGREDTTLKERIVSEAPGIAVWAIQGLLRLRRQGFTTPASSGPAIAEFRLQSSPVTAFGDECCEFGAYKLPTSILYDAYAHWAKDQGSLAGTRLRFSQRFQMMYPGVKADRMMQNGKQVRCFTGVGLTEDAINRYLIGRH
jgi:P4 family phage/plasmid primase-like protien